VNANLELKVKPVINPDNSIILDIDATNSSLGSAVPVGGGGSAPSVDTKEAKTKLLVRNGETTVIGGIYVENDSQKEIGVPLLMKIPIIGHLFKSSNSTNTRSELLIFITPRIVK
jgi:type IV pilus assembly protein PilQ